MHKNKEEIRAYYETHDISAKALSKLYKVPYRTIKYWIDSEKWEGSKAIKGIKLNKDDLLKKEFGSILKAKSDELKAQIVSNISPNALIKLDDIVLNNLLDSSVDSALLKAMSYDFFEKNQVLSALIAKDELMRMIALRDENRAEPMIVASAEKVGNMFAALKGEAAKTSTIKQEAEDLSLEEIERRLQKLE